MHPQWHKMRWLVKCQISGELGSLYSIFIARLAILIESLSCKVIPCCPWGISWFRSLLVISEWRSRLLDTPKLRNKVKSTKSTSETQAKWRNLAIKIVCKQNGGRRARTWFAIKSQATHWHPRRSIDCSETSALCFDFCQTSTQIIKLHHMDIVCGKESLATPECWKMSTVVATPAGHRWLPDLGQSSRSISVDI